MPILIDGRRVSNCSHEYRLECLARHVLRLSLVSDRRPWLADFARIHGPESLAKLQACMQAVHAANKVPSSAQK